MKYFVYILISSVDNSYYIGQTSDLKTRIKRHNQGNIKPTKSKKPYRLAYFEEYETRSGAMFREWEIKKKCNTERRTKLVNSFDNDKLIEYSGL